MKVGEKVVLLCSLGQKVSSLCGSFVFMVRRAVTIAEETVQGKLLN